MFASRRELADSVGLLVLRLAVGGMMLTHGWPKLQRLFSAPGEFADPLGVGPLASHVLAVFGEFVCAVLIIAGAATRLAAIPLFITMIVVGLVVHGADPFARKELALLYAAGAMTIALVGPGRLSIDALVLRKRATRGG